MVARFSDHKARAFAYSDLLAAGVPPSAMRAAQHPSGFANGSASGAFGLFTRFTLWLVALCARLRRHKPQQRAFGLLHARWAALQIDAPGQEDMVFGVVAHRQGTLTY